MKENKSLKAVQRSSSSSQKEFCIQFDKESNNPPDLTQHTHACTTEDVRSMIDIIQQSKPFEHQLGRQLHSFPHTSKSPIDKLHSVTLLLEKLDSVKNQEIVETIMRAQKRMINVIEPDSQDCSCLIKIIAVCDSVSSLNLQWFG